MPRSDDPVSVNAAVASGDAVRELAFRRSLQGARARRAAAALRRRRVLRGRGSALMAVAGLFVLTAGAIAQTGGSASPKALTAATIAAAQRALGIEDDGVIGPATRRAVRNFQREHGLKADGRLWPETLKALGVVAGEVQAAAAALDPRLEQIAQCESGGDPRAVSADGRYRGKYQFSRETWRSLGGRGDPAKAPEAEQDRRAAKLLARKGTAPWPSCG